uniref:Uncharacterized protein C17orf99 homolog isoform X2 n=1 Tax=Castor canadensis TaxID=51338 RepID=A0A8B7U5C2_CASCN|nr:uncharacterized protein C17orf99 homolog isoform X2 [Castor canadensis]
MEVRISSPQVSSRNTWAASLRCTPPSLRNQSIGIQQATPEISIAYQVLKVYPRGRQVRITCNASQAPPPVTYSLLASRDMQVDKKVMDTHKPASFNINITLKSSPDLLTYFCQAASSLGVHGPSARLQMYWELWAKPVSQVQVDFTLQDRESGPRAEMSCQASSGSPPISYLLVGKNGRVYMQQRPHHGQPANFQLSGMWGWFQCQAENSVSVQSSAFKLVPPAAPGTHQRAGRQPLHHCSHHLLDGPDQAVTRRHRLAESSGSASRLAFQPCGRPHHWNEEEPLEGGDGETYV